MVYMDAKKTSYFVVVAAWLAVFCLFGYRSTFAILAGPMSQTMGWTGAQVSLGYSLMMSIYAITAFFSGMIWINGVQNLFILLPQFFVCWVFI